MKYLKLTLISLIIGGLCQYSNAEPVDSYDDFIGTFILIENAKEKNLIKIEKQNKVYLAREWSEIDEKWDELFPLTKTEKFLSYKSEFKGVIGFKTDAGLIVKVPVGWKYGEYTAKAGFAFVTDYASIDLHKIENVHTNIHKK